MSATRVGAGREAPAPLPRAVSVLTAGAKHDGRPVRLRPVLSRLQDVGRPDVPEAGRRDRELDEAIRAVVNSRFGSGFAVESLNAMPACATMLETGFSSSCKLVCYGVCS